MDADELFFGLGARRRRRRSPVRRRRRSPVRRRRKSPVRRRRRRSPVRRSGCSGKMSITRLRKIAQDNGVDIYSMAKRKINRRTGSPMKRKLIKSCSTLKRRLKEAGLEHVYKGSADGYASLSGLMGAGPELGPCMPGQVFDPFQGCISGGGMGPCGPNQSYDPVQGCIDDPIGPMYGPVLPSPVLAAGGVGPLGDTFTPGVQVQPHRDLKALVRGGLRRQITANKTAGLAKRVKDQIAKERAEAGRARVDPAGPIVAAQAARAANVHKQRRAADGQCYRRSLWDDYYSKIQPGGGAAKTAAQITALWDAAPQDCADYDDNLSEEDLAGAAGFDLSFGRRHRVSPRRHRKLHTGPQGGKYYISRGRKVYVKSPGKRRSPRRRRRRRSAFGYDSDSDY